MLNALSTAIFIDGTFIPARDGASERFAHLPRALAELGIPTIVFHCYRGWSDLEAIRQQPFTTYLMRSDVYYQDMSLIVELLRRHAVKIVQVNDLETMQAVGFRLAHVYDVRLVYEAHYHSSTLARALGVGQSQLASIRDLENGVVRFADGVIVFTEVDRRRWIGLSDADANRVNIVPFGVDGVGSAGTTGGSGLVFLGNMYFEPNSLALEYIATQIIPRVRERLPEARCTIIGDTPPELRQRFAADDLTFYGEVPDVAPFLRRARVGLAPVMAGSGVRVKVLKYLAAGLPVVASSAAAEGLAFPAVYIEDDIEGCVARCVQILLHPKESAKDSRESQALLRERFSWESIAELAIESYSSVLRLPIRDRALAPARTVDLPMWMEEVLRKGRFGGAALGPLESCRYGVAGHGRLEWHH
jgi:hypothetical protein